jgi:hypothetical protein
MSSDHESANHVVIFRTGKVWEFDMARDALKQHNIPFFGQTDNVSGVRTAVDAMPTPGPGAFWSILVPEQAAHRAQQILRQCRLDVEKKPLIWDFNPAPEGKKFWKSYATFTLIIGIVFLILWAIRTFR